MGTGNELQRQRSVAGNELSSPSTSLNGINRRLFRNSQMPQSQLNDYASRVMALDDEGESFVQRIHRLFTEAGTPRTAC